MITKLWLQRWWWETEQQLSWTSLSVIPTRIKQYMCILCHSYILCLYVSSSCQFLLIHEYVNRWFVITLILYRQGEQKWKETIKVTQEFFTVNPDFTEQKSAWNTILYTYCTLQIFNFLIHVRVNCEWNEWCEWINVLMNEWTNKKILNYSSTSDLPPSTAIADHLPGQLVSTKIRTVGVKLFNSP